MYVKLISICIHISKQSMSRLLDGQVYPDKLGCLCTKQALRVGTGQILLGMRLRPCRRAVHASWLTVRAPEVPPEPQSR